MQARQIVIGGFGAAGAATALALVSGGVAPGDILIFDQNPDANPLGSKASGSKALDSKTLAGGAAPGGDARILALNGGSRRFLSALGVWEVLADNAFPMHSMAISDTGLEEPFRPRLLEMEAPAEGEPLAHLVPLGLLNTALRDRCRASGMEVIKARLAGFAATESGLRIDLGNRQVEAGLLIGADGAKSPIRMRAGIPAHGWAYGQSAIVATIRHSLAHRGEAVQHFLPSGPFALLPLDEFRSSMVWSEKSDVALGILASDSAAQRRAIEVRAAGWRGEILAVETISSHPLQLSLARRYIHARLALVADAAHVVHPLAGQGLNLGFEDAATLAELVVERLRLGLDPGAPDMLEIYQASRRPAAAAMAFATEGLNRLFSNDSSPLRLLRDFGAGLIERLPAAKRQLMAAASGQSALAPRLFRGEAI